MIRCKKVTMTLDHFTLRLLNEVVKLHHKRGERMNLSAAIRLIVRQGAGVPLGAWRKE